MNAEKLLDIYNATAESAQEYADEEGLSSIERSNRLLDVRTIELMIEELREQAA